MSPFGEAGLLFDPLSKIIGSDYDEFMRKTWEKPNEVLSPYAKKFHKFERDNPWINPLQAEIDKTEFGGKIKGMSENKPGDAALAILGTVFGGGALLGGMGGGSGGGGGLFGGGSSGNINPLWGSQGQTIPGISGNVSTGTGIYGNTGFNAAVSPTASSQGFMGQVGGAQGLMGMGQGLLGGVPGMPGQQQEQQQGPKPYLVRGQVVWM